MTASAYAASDDGSLSGPFLQMAARHPERLAVFTSRGSLSYGQLCDQAVAVAQALRLHGVDRGVLVGLLLPRSLEAVVAVLGTLLAGGAYVPIDLEYPVDRQQFLLEDSRVSVVVTSHRLVSLHAAANLDSTLDRCAVVDLDEALAEPLPLDFVPTALRSEDLLYVLYSSGSTGRPKGVCGTHGATLNRLRWGFEQYPFVDLPTEVVAHRSSLNFVDSVAELFSGLLSGVPTALLHPEETRDLRGLVALLRRFEVTRLTVVPSLLAAILRAAPELEKALPRLKLWTCSGEELPLSLLRQFRAAHPSATLLNIYGSTEVTADVTCAEFPPDAPLPSVRVPIGTAMAGAELLILDEHQVPVPDGQSGELYVGGPVLSRGYLRRPVEQAERFLPHPFRPGQLVFRTGDRVRREPDGQLSFLGRQDNQVKVLGIRIELEEIERTLSQACPELGQIAIIVKEQPDQLLSRRLCALCTPADVDVTRLRSAARQHLPAHMLPAEYLPMTRLPLLPNGKLDRPALLRIAISARRRLPPERLPQSPTEQRLAAILGSVLGQEVIARDDSFADLGGNSLALAELLVALDRDFNSNFLESEHVYHQPLHQIARWIDQGAAPAVDSDELPSYSIQPLATLDIESLVLLAAETDAHREPLTVATDLSIDDQRPYVTPLIAASRAEGMSFLARRPDTDEVIGFCIAHDFCSNPPHGHAELAPSLRPVVQILADLEADYVEQFGQPSPGEVIYLSMTGVSPAIQGYELARQLELRALQAAHRRGYRIAVTICTSRITAVMAERAGFRRLSSRPYATYQFEGQPVFAALAALHREAILFVQEIS